MPFKNPSNPTSIPKPRPQRPLNPDRSHKLLNQSIPAARALSWTPLGRGSFVAVAGGMWLGEGWALRALALLLLGSSAGWGSESPDRDCCEPLYPFIPPPTESTSTTTITTTTTTRRTTITLRTTPRRTLPPLTTTTTTTTTTLRPYIPPPTRKPSITTVVFIPSGRGPSVYSLSIRGWT